MHLFLIDCRGVSQELGIPGIKSSHGLSIWLADCLAVDPGQPHGDLVNPSIAKLGLLHCLNSGKG